MDDYQTPFSMIHRRFPEVKALVLLSVLIFVYYNFLLEIVHSLHYSTYANDDMYQLIKTYASFVIDKLPNATVAKYYMSVKTNITHTRIVLALGFSFVIPCLMLITAYRKVFLSAPLENSTGYRIWQTYTGAIGLRLFLLCTYIYVVFFKGFYLSTIFRSGYDTATDLGAQAAVAMLFGVTTSFMISIIFNSLYNLTKLRS